MVLKRLVIIVSSLMLLFYQLPSTALAEGPGNKHAVRPGETLAAIAAQHGITAQALLAANNLRNPDLLWVGEKLVIPGAGNPLPASKPAPAPLGIAGLSSHTVQRGQTLSQIAGLYGVNPAALAQANGIVDPNLIRPGQALIIPKRADDAGTAQQASGTRFVASISQQRCWLYQNGQLVGNWPCSSGRKESPTVPGSYKIQSKINPAYASTWDFWMPYWLGLYYSGNIENGIHGLPYNPTTGRRTWEGLVGTPITYGCIMLENENAKKLYEIAYVGMPVIILP